MTHQNAIMLIYVFSTFGLVLLLLLGVFYVCHLYGQRLDREARQNQAAADLVSCFPAQAPLCHWLCSHSLVHYRTERKNLFQSSKLVLSSNQTGEAMCVTCTRLCCAY